MIIKNEGDVFPKDIIIKCEPNNIVEFKPIKKKIDNINDKELKTMIYLNRIGNIGDNENNIYLICNVNDKYNNCLAGNMYNIIIKN
jgi:hypothetical protein